MNLFTPDLTVLFLPAELDVFTRPIEGDGGHQRFLRELIPRLHGLTLTVSDDELQKAYRYAFEYGHCGYQDRFKVLLAAARRQGWKRSGDLAEAVDRDNRADERMEQRLRDKDRAGL